MTGLGGATAAWMPWIFAAVAMVLASFGTGYVLRWTLRRGVLDIPNERSSHSRPTPRGGGLAIVVATALAWGAAAFAVPGFAPWLAALLPGFAAIAWIGWRDDVTPVPPLHRLFVHLASAAACVAVLAIEAGGTLSGLRGPLVAVVVVYVLAIAWGTNLYNFMDGIDGIAGLQAVFVGVAGAVLCAMHGLPAGSTVFAVLAAASAGFLRFNRPPARIFMGDVGSGALGFALAGAGALALESGVGTVWTWLLLWGAFLVDATTTLVVRMARGDRFYAPHRTHVYQHLARRWGHGRVAMMFAAINVGVLFPAAVASVRLPETGYWLAPSILSSLAAAALAFRAGRPPRVR